MFLMFPLDLDEMHETKRRIVQDFKASEKEYKDVKQEENKVKRQGSFIKKQERRNTMESFQQDLYVYIFSIVCDVVSVHVY